MVDITTRVATISDVAFLERVFVDSMKESITAARGQWDVNREIAQFRQQLALDSTKVIQQDGVDVGFVMTAHAGQELQIHTLCITPECQEQGIGSSIVELVIHDARESGRRVILSVLKVNTRARALYERLGFDVADESEHHYHLRHRK